MKYIYNENSIHGSYCLKQNSYMLDNSILELTTHSCTSLHIQLNHHQLIRSKPPKTIKNFATNFYYDFFNDYIGVHLCRLVIKC